MASAAVPNGTAATSPVRVRRARILIGAALGLALLVFTLARVDLGSVVTVLAAADPLRLAAALVVVLVDLAIRGLRWQVLLAGLRGPRRPSFPLAVGYLTIGYLANLLLPVRLGDLARAFLAGTAFRVGRLPVLGTILVERLADGGTMLTLALLSSLLVAGVAGTATVRSLALYAALLVLAGLAALTLAWWLVTRTPVGRTSAARFGAELASRLSEGLRAARTLAGAAALAATTAAAAATAVLVAWLVASAVGIALPIEQAVLFMSAIALSLAIPAAPGSLGTYEFVGVTVLTSLGHSPERALATIVLMRAVSTFPPIAIGLVSAWVLHLRPAVIVDTVDVADSEPGAPEVGAATTPG